MFHIIQVSFRGPCGPRIFKNASFFSIFVWGLRVKMALFLLCVYWVCLLTIIYPLMNTSHKLSNTENRISGVNAGLECLLIPLPLDYLVGLISIFRAYHRMRPLWEYKVYSTLNEYVQYCRPVNTPKCCRITCLMPYVVYYLNGDTEKSVQIKQLTYFLNRYWALV